MTSLRPPFATILCPTDLSEVGDGAVAVAARLLAPEGVLHLLHVTEPFHAPPGPLRGSDALRARGEEEARLRRRLEGLVPAGTRIHVHVLESLDVPGVVEQQARRHGADVVVMSTHGRSGLPRLLLGSVAAEVVKKVDLPVILVRAGGG